MHNFVVRVYRTRSEDAESISGSIEDIKSGQKESFHSFNELQSILAYSIGIRPLGFPDFVPQMLDTHGKVAESD